MQNLPTIAYESQEVLNALSVSLLVTTQLALAQFACKCLRSSISTASVCRSVKELRKRLRQRQIDSTGCLERGDLLHLLHTTRSMRRNFLLCCPLPCLCIHKYTHTYMTVLICSTVGAAAALVRFVWKNTRRSVHNSFVQKFILRICMCSDTPEKQNQMNHRATCCVCCRNATISSISNASTRGA